MRRAIQLLIVACAADGCGGGYLIEQNVTVPAEVQRVFSASGPGWVMDQRMILGVLCAPSDEPVILHRESGWQYSSCDAKKGFQDQVSGTAYAFRPTGAELERLDARTREILACGQSGSVEDSRARKDVFESHFYNSVEPERYLAVGSAKGECVSSSHYLVNITLALR